MTNEENNKTEQKMFETNPTGRIICDNCNGRGLVGYYEYDPAFKQAFLVGSTECRVCHGIGYL